MKRKICILLAAFTLLLTPTIQAFAKEENVMKKEAYHIYVSSSADSEVADGSKKNPFANISSAKEFVKTLDKTKGDIIVEIADGTYFLDETLSFDKTDSGSEKCSVRYVAAQGAKPVISGGKKVSGQWKDEGNGIFSVEYDRSEKLRALYVNNERRYMTSKKIKGKGPYGEMQIKAGQADWAWADGNASTGVLFSSGAIPLDTRNQDDIELMTKTTWNTAIVCVESLEKKDGKLLANLQMPFGAIAQTPGWGNAYQFKKTNFVYNVFEWLDEPGEFYFDKTEKRLYYYPTENEDINDIDVVVPEIETLIDICGENKSNRVSNISFENLTFAHTDWNLCEVNGSHGRVTNQGATVLEKYDDVDWHGAIYRAYDIAPAAIQVSSANSVSFLNNTVAHTGNEGLSLINDACDITVDGNIFYDIGGSGILIGHPQHMYIGDKGMGYGRFSEREKYDAETEESCQNLTVTNNLVKSTSRLFWGDSGVMVFACENMLFQYNQVEDTPYSGISLGWGWWNMDGSEGSVVPGVPTTTTKNNKLLNNRFINTITILADAGAIYTLGDMPGTVISENYIDHIGTDGAKASYHIRGIHIDEGSKHIYGEKNVININPEFAAVDCGNWGYKGSNEWNGNFTTSDKYKTTDDFEPDTVITNMVISPDAEWGEEAEQIIKKAGISSAYTHITDNEWFSLTDYNLPYVPKKSINIVALISGICAGAVVLLGVVSGVLIHKKRKKEKG